MDYLREAKVFRLSVYNTSTSRIARTVFVYSIIRPKEEVLVKLKSYLSKLEIPEKITIYALGDGAKWVKDVLESLHNNIKFTLDYYHAAGYLKIISELKYFTRHKQGKNAGKKYRKILKKKGGKKIIQDLRDLKSKIKKSNLTNNEKEVDHKKINKILEYMVPRNAQMNYPLEIEHGRPIGSGFIESACKYIVKQRLCLSGARFCLEDAERVMQLRCLIMMQAWVELTELMYKKCFTLKHCCPSSSYEPVIPKKQNAA